MSVVERILGAPTVWFIHEGWRGRWYTRSPLNYRLMLTLMPKRSLHHPGQHVWIHLQF